MRKGAVVLAFVSVALLDCATLDPLAEGACGNGVIDANEDCDGRAPSGLPNGKGGAPTEGASACRLQCASAGDCPDGWGCSVTGICREPSGKFGAIGEGVSAGVETMVVGDFDGDRRKDILGSGPQSATSTAKVRVHYFGDNATLAQVNALAAPISSPTVKDFNGDGVDDFAFGLDISALGVITGQPDRTLVPAVFPSFRVPRSDSKPILANAVTRPLPGGGKVGILFAGTFSTKEGKKNLLTSADAPGEGYLRELPVGTDAILGDPGWGTFLNDGSSTCGEIAIALKSSGNGVIQVYAPCRPLGAGSEWTNNRAPITIDPPGPLEGGLFVIDEKNDGKQDILFGVKDGSGITVWLARSNGTGFDAPIETPLHELPLAAGDLDFDGEVDLVLPSLIALSSRGTPVDGGTDAGSGTGLTPFTGYDVRYSDRRVRWTSARIGMLNGDDLPDVVAGSSDQPDLDFFAATFVGKFVQSTISTSGPVSRLSIGDFDGDKLGDVGFIQQRPGSGALFDVSVAYGRANGPPEPARIIGRTEEAFALLTLDDSSGEGTQNLVLFSEKTAADGGLPDIAVALIVGNGDRQPVAPLLLDDQVSRRRETDPDIVREWVPLEVHAANVADPNRIDLIALAVGYRISIKAKDIAPGPFPAAVWVAPGTGGTGFDAPTQVADLDGFAIGGARSSAFVFEARSAIDDIDNPKDGRADVVVLQRLPGKDSLQLFVARLDGEPTPVELPGERIRRDAPFTLVDVDGDGNLDAVALFGDEDDKKVVVFFNDAKGGFVTPGVTVTIPGENDVVPNGFAFLTTRGASSDGGRKAKRELAIVTKKRIVLAAPDPADRTKFLLRDVVLEGGAPLAAATAIAQGDFDGDGVADLAIADGGALRILRQLPVK